MLKGLLLVGTTQRRALQSWMTKRSTWPFSILRWGYFGKGQCWTQNSPRRIHARITAGLWTAVMRIPNVCIQWRIFHHEILRVQSKKRYVRAKPDVLGSI